MSCNCFGCVVVYLKYVNLSGQSYPQSPYFFHLSVNKKMPWECYCLGGANFCLRSCPKINSLKMEVFSLISPLQVTLQRQYLLLLL